MKTSELTGAALDWAVATANGGYPQWDADWEVFYQANGDDMNYSTDWKQGGPIIERENIAVRPFDDSDLPGEWGARDELLGFTHWTYGPTPLIAAMRCYVASKLGDEVEIPEELTGA